MALLKRKRVGLNDAMSVVTRFVNACNRHDADGVGACLHPDFDSIQPMYPSRNFRGADQVRRNWQAIFDAEPGFRLTVLRSAAAEDTVWLELHGAGRDAEVAGVFIMGVQGDRIRWARIYSALVEPVPAGMGEPPVPLHEVPHPTDAGVVGSGEVVEEALIAPVLDIERSGRRRRRRGSPDEVGTTAATAEEDTADEVVPADEPDAVVAAEAAQGDAVTVAVGVEDQAVPAAAADVEADVAVVTDSEEAAVVVAGDADVAVVADDEVVAVVTEDADVAVVVADDADVAVVAADDEEDGGPPTEAVDMVTFTELEAEPEFPPSDAPPGEPTKRWFGKRPRP